MHLKTMVLLSILFPLAYGLAESTLCVSFCRVDTGYHDLRLAKKAFQKHQVELMVGAVDESETQIVVSCGQVNDIVKIVHPKTLTLCEAYEIGEVWLSGAERGAGLLAETRTHKRSFSSTY